MLPIKVEIPTQRLEAYDQNINYAMLEETLDFIEENRTRVQLINATYQQRITKHFNKKVRDRQFAVGDLVLR